MTRKECHTCKDRAYSWAHFEKGDFKQDKELFGTFIFFECVSPANEDTSVIDSYISDMKCSQYNPEKEREKE